MDPDFKDRMFARQIAVMKGQAWNVVETLKQADHGPLELTRRTRVCVWDDLVDVPVAIPMRAPSMEIKRKQKSVRIEQDEMDIGASYSTPRQPPQDLLGSPTSELPNPNRFELTRDDSAADLGNIGEEQPVSPVSIPDNNSRDYLDAHSREARDNLSSSITIPARPSAKGKTRFSFDFSRSLPGTVRRQRSMSTRSGVRPQNNLIAQGWGDDDLEGDLGYSAANDMEGHKRKVIVERLETVKTKNPVFTWC
jgi:hypothetical protein